MRRCFLLAVLVTVLFAVFTFPASAGSIFYNADISLERELALTEENEAWQGLDADWHAWRDDMGQAMRPAPAEYDGMQLWELPVYTLDSEYASVDFSPACDLDAYRELSLICQIATGRGSTGLYYLNLLFYAGEDTMVSEIALPANSWCRIMLDIGSWPSRSEVNRIELRLVREGGSGSAQLQFTHLAVGEAMNEALRERFLSDTYRARGGDFFMTAGAEVAYLIPTDNSPMLEAQVLVPQTKTETNALRLVFDNETACEKITLHYAYRPDGGDARSVSLTVGRGSQTCLFEAPDAGQIRYIRLVFTGAREGLITLHALNAVSVYDSGIAPQGSVNECRLDEEGANILVKGTVAHDVMIANRQNKLALFAVAPWEDVQTVLSDGRAPDAEADISIRFEFKLPLRDGDYAALGASYLVAIKTGEEYSLYTPIADPRSLSISADLSDADAPDAPAGQSAIKGVQTALVSTAEQAGVSVYLVDVYLDRLSDGSASGYLYTRGGQNYYFDHTVLGELDQAVAVRSAAGASVYLRFLISDGGIPVDYALDPESATPGATRGILLGSAAARDQIGAITEFLTARYSGNHTSGEHSYGAIAGIVVGEAIDDAAVHNEIGVQSLSDYVDHYASLLTLIANSARRQNSEMAIVVPISDRRSAVCITADLLENSYDSELFLRSLFKRIDDFGGLRLSLMLESEHNPFSLDASVLKSGEAAEHAEEDESAAPAEPDYYNADNLGDFSALLDGMSASYASMPGTFLYCWIPTEETGDALAAAYAYLYYRLRFSTHAEAFIVSFARAEENGDSSGMLKLRHLMKYIDTARSLEVSEPALAVFGAADWRELIADFDSRVLARRIYLEGELADAAPEPLGTYFYWNFAASHSTRGWRAGTHVSSITVRGSGSDRALIASLDRTAAQTGEYSELIYRFSPAEPLGIFDRVAFSVMLDSADGGAWEVCVYTGTPAMRLEQKRVIEAGERFTLYLSPSALGESGADYLKLCVKPISGGGEEAKLCLYSVRGESDTIDGDAVKEKLVALRRTSGDSEASAPVISPAWVFAISAVVIFSLAVVVWLGRQRGENEKEDA